MTGFRLGFGLVFLWAASAAAAPAFPWTSFGAIANERPAGNAGLCSPDNPGTQISDVIIRRPQEFYHLWAMLRGPGWVAVHYDADARPDWVWRGTWSGDALTVTSVSPYDRYAHASACDMLFEPTL